MKKALMWIKMAVYFLPIWLTGLRSKKEDFEVRYEVARHWTNKIVKASGARIVCKGAEKVPTDRTVYFVSNHQGSLDPFIFVTYAPVPTTLVSKIENGNIPFIGLWMKNLEVIGFKREDVRESLRMVKDTAAALEKGRNVIIYPEGTRSKGPQMKEFKAGALKPALMAKVTIVPITMNNSYLIDVPNDENKEITIEFHDPIDYSEYESMNTVELADKVLSVIQSTIDMKEN